MSTLKARSGEGIRFIRLERVSLIFYVLAASILEYLITDVFVSFGLRDDWKLSLSIPNLNFTFSLSLILHVIPIIVIMALVLSWIHITRYTGQIRIENERAARQITKRKRRERRRVPQPERGISSLNRFFGGIWNTLVTPFTAFLRIIRRSRVVKYFEERPSAVAAIKGAVIILAAFTALASLVYLLEYPDTIYYLTVNFYKCNPFLLNFVYGSHETIRRISESLGPVVWAPSAINQALLGYSPSFRKSVELMFKPVSSAFTSLDLMSGRPPIV